MLKKLLKMNLALLLVGSSASVISTNNIVFAEENPHDESNSNMEQNEIIDEISEEGSVVNADSVARTPLTSFKGLEELEASSDGGFVLNFSFDVDQLKNEGGKIEYIEFKLYNGDTDDLLMERNIVFASYTNDINKNNGKLEQSVDVFQAPNVDDKISLYATVRLIAYKDAGFNDTFSDSKPTTFIFKNMYKSNLNKPYFEPNIVPIGIDKEKRGFAFKFDEANQSKVTFNNYEVSIETVDKYGYQPLGSAKISASSTDKEFYVGEYKGNGFDPNDIDNGLIKTSLSKGSYYYIRVTDGKEVKYDSLSAGWAKLGYYEGQVATPKAFDASIQGNNYSTEFNTKSRDIELTLKNLISGNKYALSKDNNLEDKDMFLEWKTAESDTMKFTELESGAQYYVYTKAVDTEGNKIDSKSAVSVDAITVARNPHPHVKNLKATSENGTEITLNWTVDDVSNTAINIQIERDDTIIVNNLEPTATSYTDSNLDPGTTYTYVVSVLNSDGADGIAKRVTASTIPVPTIKKLVVDDSDVKNNKLTVNWDVDSNDPDESKKATTKLEVKVNDEKDSYFEIFSNGAQKGVHTFDLSAEDGKYIGKDLVFKLTAKGRGGENDKTVNYIIERGSSSSSSSSSSSFTGWKSNGSYYEKGKPVSGIKEIKGVTYMFDKKGFPMKNQMIEIKEKTYITDDKGIICKGKTEFEGATYVMDKTDGHMLRDWALVDGEWYFMSYETGKVHMNLWAPSASGDWYFMDAEGHMKKNQWIASSEGRWYYVGADGKMVSNSSVDGYWINEQGIYLSPTYKG